MRARLNLLSTAVHARFLTLCSTDVFKAIPTELVTLEKRLQNLYALFCSSLTEFRA